MSTPDTPKAPPIARPGEGTIAQRVAAGLALRPAPLDDRHLSRLAIVYVRQSDPQQVLDHKESRERQYALADLAVGPGLAQGPGPAHRRGPGPQRPDGRAAAGFQRLLAEVTMDHVGLVLGTRDEPPVPLIKDWHHLLEVCAIFGTLLADQDGVYDPNDTNDRLLLGLKGTMSEFELIHHAQPTGARQRLHKAERGELFLDVPVRVRQAALRRVGRDPDEQVRAIVQLIFDKFDELGSFRRSSAICVRNKIRLGVPRPARAPARRAGVAAGPPRAC